MEGRGAAAQHASSIRSLAPFFGGSPSAYAGDHVLLEDDFTTGLRHI